jgi:hypothetical protein
MRGKNNRSTNFQVSVRKLSPPRYCLRYLWSVLKMHVELSNIHIDLFAGFKEQFIKDVLSM